MPRPEIQRNFGRGPLGSAGTASSPDNHHIPTRTPGAIGINDAAAASINKAISVLSNQSQIPYGANFTVEELSCILRHRKRWKDLLEGRWDQAFYSGYSAIFQSMSEILYPEKNPNQIVSNSPIIILDRAYSKLCQYEYNMIKPELKKAFKDQSQANKVTPPWLYYRLLRGGYVKQGITYPYEAINSIDPNFKFMGKPVWKGLHKDFSKLLLKVEKRITKAGLSISGFKLKHWGGFVPRFIAGTKTISKHSIGLAIDLEYPTNPHLKGNVAMAIDAILDHLNKDGKGVSGRVRKNFKGYGEMSMQDFDRLKEISDFLVKFLQEWIPKWESFQKTIQRERNLGHSSMPEDEWKDVDRERSRHLKDYETYKLIEALIKACGGIAKVKAFRKYGIVTIDGELFKAMKAEGVKSGIEYSSSKDTMHFELPMSLKRWSRKNGYTRH